MYYIIIVLNMQRNKALGGPLDLMAVVEDINCFHLATSGDS